MEAWLAAAVIVAVLSILQLPRVVYAAAALLSTRGRRPARVEGVRATVSVIVPARQEPLPLIRGLLANLAGQRCRPLEVIIVWDAPTTGYERVAREAWRLGEELGLRVRVVAKPWRGRGKASVLNYASRLARGDYILVIDVDDRLASPDALCEALGEAGEAGAVQLGVVGVAYLHPLQSPTAAAIHAGFRVLHEGRVRLGAQPLLVGSGMLVSRRLLLRHPFDEDMIVEDVDLAVRLGAVGVEPAVLPRLLAMAGAPGYRAFRRQQSRWSRGVAAILARRARLLASMGARGAELAYLLASYALDALAAMAAGCYAAASLLLGWPAWPLSLYTSVVLAQAAAVAPLSRDAPLRRRLRSGATAAAMALALQPVLLLNWVRGLLRPTAVFQVTPRRVSGRERPGRLETVYMLVLGALGAAVAASGHVYAALGLLNHLPALAYLHYRLPRLARASSSPRPRGPSRRRASPR